MHQQFRNLIGILLFITACMLSFPKLTAGFCEDYGICGKGKVDVGPAYIHIDILESNKTVRSMDLCAGRADATIIFLKDRGWNLKPVILYGSGGSKTGQIFSAGVGLGHCFPITEMITLNPLFGVNYTYLDTHIRIPLLEPVFGKDRFLETFRSISPFIGLEAYLELTPCWRICATVQYAWSRTHTKIKKVLKDKSRTQGFNYALLIEYDFMKNFSVNIGGAYNLSLSKEKHGIRAAGVKLGFAYWF